eukprot:7250950-Alexandrium_andersonii.AAC.1
MTRRHHICGVCPGNRHLKPRGSSHAVRLPRVLAKCTAVAIAYVFAVSLYALGCKSMVAVASTHSNACGA